MISMASDNDQSDHWLRHAILCLFLDLSESEVRAMNKDMLAEQCSSRREFRRHASVDNSDLQGPSNSLTDAKLGEAKKPKKNEKGLLSAEASSSKVESSSSMDTENEGAFYDDVVLSTMMEATSTAASNLSDADSLQLETLKVLFFYTLENYSIFSILGPILHRVSDEFF
jgi:hypothetical protein